MFLDEMQAFVPSTEMLQQWPDKLICWNINKQLIDCRTDWLTLLATAHTEYFSTTYDRSPSEPTPPYMWSMA